jgi:hypothetical protein
VTGGPVEAWGSIPIRSLPAYNVSAQDRSVAKLKQESFGFACLASVLCLTGTLRSIVTSCWVLISVVCYIL